MEENGIDKLRLLDEFVSAFEGSLRQGNPESLDKQLRDIPDLLESQKDFVFQELLTAELEYQLRKGIRTKPEDYLARFPAYAAAVRNAFATVAELSMKNEAPTELIAVDDTEPVASPVEPEKGNSTDSDLQPTMIGGSTIERTETEIPEQFGRYRLIELLGRGGMGRVYLAHDSQLDRQVALKIPEFYRHPEHAIEAVRRFHREARSMATVRHPNLCPIYDVGAVDGRPYLTMAWIDGPTLAEWKRSQKSVPVSEVVRIMLSLCDATQAIHDAGILHRDLKPSNVMLDGRSDPIITDFGLASRNRQSEAELTGSGVVLGSPFYMGPEQIEAKQDEIGPHSDVYSLGVMFYELLCGRRPYEGSTMSVLGQISSGQQPTPLSEFVQIDGRLEAVCMKAMAHRVQDRYSSAAALAEALKGLSDGPVGPQRPTHKRAGFVSAGVIILVLIGLAVIFRPTHEESGADLSGELSTETGKSDSEVSADPDAPPSSLLPLRAVPSRVSTGEFYDSGQEIGGAHTANVAAGDVDGDGDVDVVLANIEGANQVWLNDGSGKFEVGHELLAEKSVHVKLGDLDADGDLDAVFVTWRSPDSGSIWLNDGTGRFSRAVWAPPAGLFAVALADIDSDDDLDAILASRRGPNIVVRNDGTGQLAESGQLLGDSDSRGLGIADLDNDGDVDLFVCNYSGLPNTVWLNDGTGSFTDSGQTLGDSKSSGVAFVDADSDGDLDAYVINVDKPCSLYINDGTGQFEVTTLFSDVLTSGGIAVADLNGDGQEDIFTTGGFRRRPEQARILMAHQNGKGFYSNWSLTATSSDAALADFDADGDVDAFVANVVPPSRVWFNRDIDEEFVPDRQVEFHDSGQTLGSASSHAVAVGDLDGDRNTDFVVANFHEGEVTQIWLNDGTGVFVEGQGLRTVKAADVQVGDLDGDGDLDLAIAENTDADANRIWLNDGHGHFQLAKHQPPSVTSQSLGLGDLDNDGDLDAIIAGADGPNVVWWNDGHGAFFDSGQKLGDSPSLDVAVADLDNDGDLDAFASNWVQPNRVWLNDGKGTFTDSGQELGRFQSLKVALADMDRDGDIDAVVGSERLVCLWVNDGTGQFSLADVTAGTTHGVAVSAADLNRDGRVEILTGSGNEGIEKSVQILSWSGVSGEWSSRPLASDVTVDIAVADVDNDGDLDAILINGFKRPNRIWLNTLNDETSGRDEAR